MKRFTHILLISLLLVLAVSSAAVFATGHIAENERWHAVSPADLDQMHDSHDSFLLVFYYPEILGSNDRIDYLDDWMSLYGFDAYGLDVKENKFLSDWLYDPVTDHGSQNGIDIPSFILVDGDAVTVLPGNISLRNFRSTLGDFFHFSSSGELGYDRVNTRVYDGYSTRINSARLRDMRSIETVAVDPAIGETALSITESCPQDIDKLKAIYDWVTEHIYYDYVMLADPSAGDISATYTYQTGHSVCEGYARLTKEMCNAVGIPCRMASGFAAGVGAEEDGAAVRTRYEAYLEDEDLASFAEDMAAHQYENHAWNEALIGGRWVIVDATWGSGNSYTYMEGYDGPVFVDADSSDYYFDPDLDYFSESHVFWNEQAEDLVTELSGGQLNVQAALEPEDAAAGSMAFVASYNKNGRMIDVAVTPVGDGSIDVSLDDPMETDTVMLSVVDASGCPVAAVYEGSFASAY